jgi:large conductance mechanosensitive channel
MMNKLNKKKEEPAPEPEPEPIPEPTKEELLLTEIRDLLKANKE